MTDKKMLTEAYRPYVLADIIGHEQQKRLVGSWFSTARVPRSILITGEFSAGKTTFARIVGRTLLCRNAEGDAIPDAPCGKCTACEAFDKDQHNDYIEVDAASDRGIDAMKDLARRIRMLPNFGKRKVLVLDEAHQITGPGWQAMLKTVEEPPAHVVIIIVTTNPEKIPNTIVSRCSALKLRAVPVEDCVALLTKIAKDKGLSKAGVTKEHLTKIAKVTHGHPRNALHALDQVYTMALAAMQAGGQGVALDAALVNGFIDQVAVSDVEATAGAIVRAILDGKPGGAMKRVEDNRAEADMLLTKLLIILRQAMLLSTSPKLLDPYYREAFEGVTLFANKEAKYAVIDAFEVFTRLRIDTSNHTVPVAEVLDAAVCRAGLIVQKFITAAKATPVATEEKPAATPTRVAAPPAKPKPVVEAATSAPASDPDDDGTPPMTPPKRSAAAPNVSLP